jgi:transketolase
VRQAFIETLVERAAVNPRIVLLTGDLGYLAVEPFAEQYPERFFNVGVAEQNMMGLATGLAEGGFTPFVYSIAPFAVLRPYEFLRNGPIQHRLPVRVVGVGGGFEYASNGFSHYALEDIAVLRTQPGLTLLTPADYTQASSALRAAEDLPGPLYFRLGKDNETVVPGLEGRFVLGQVQLLRPGRDLLIVALGPIAVEALGAAVTLSAQGIEAAVALIDNLHEATASSLRALLADYHDVMTVEAHYLNGGIGSLVSEVAAEEGLGCRVVRCGVQALEPGISGSQSYLLDAHGLSARKLAETAVTLFQKA